MSHRRLHSKQSKNSFSTTSNGNIFHLNICTETIFQTLIICVSYMIPLELSVGPYVLGQVIAAHKLFVALDAFEPLLTRVCPPVSLQFV